MDKNPTNTNESMKDKRKQMNMPDDVVKILDDFARRGAKDIFPTKDDPLSYPDTIRYMATKLDPKNYGRKASKS